MPRIIINENDNTFAGNTSYSNFTVVVPGFCAKGNAKNLQPVTEFTLQADFKNKVGLVSVTKNGKSKSAGAENPVVHYGNQVAYELLGLGYKVLYMSLGDKPEEDPTEGLAQLTTDEFWDNVREEDFRYITTGLINGSEQIDAIAAANAICRLASHKNEEIKADDPVSASTGKNGKGDCIALVDFDESKLESKAVRDTLLKAILSGTKNYADADTNAAIFIPSVCYKAGLRDIAMFDHNNIMPASFHYLACAANAADNNFGEQYAVAGYARGTTPKYVIDNVSIKLGEYALNVLNPRAVAEPDGTRALNVITKLGKAYYIWSNRTAEPLDMAGLTAKHFLNIRQICTTIKKQAIYACKRVAFDPNSDNTWTNLSSYITPVLEKFKADQGIDDYRLVKKPTDIKGCFKASIEIVPIEAVEDFEITLNLEDALGETSVNLSEASKEE